MHCQIKLAPDFANISLLESFIYENKCLLQCEQARTLLITTELFENIIAHSKGTRFCLIVIRRSFFGNSTIKIKYDSKNFYNFIVGKRLSKPHYDSASNRYRGLGLRMCSNLASSITFRWGLFKSSIIINL